MKLLKRLRRRIFMLGIACYGLPMNVLAYNPTCVANTLQHINELNYVIQNVELTTQNRMNYRYQLHKTVLFLKGC